MDKSPVNNFINSETALEGAGSLKNEQAVTAELLDLPEDAGRDDVIDAFVSRQTSLSKSLEEVQARPGFNLDANEMIAKRAEQSQAEQALNELTDNWTELGGDEILEAQSAVDALNFNSTATDRVNAANRLRDAKNAFYENYTASRAEDGETTAQSENDDTIEVGDETPVEPSETTEETPLVRITRPAAKRYEEQQAALNAAQAAEAPEHADIDGSYDTKDAPIKGIDTTADALDNWHEMMKNEREAKTDATTQRSHELGGAAIDLLADSEVVADYRAAREKRRALFKRMQGSFAARRMNVEMRKMQKTHAKELKAFDKQAEKARALQEAEDKATVASAGREEALSDKLFEKRLKAEAKLKDKQEAKMDSFKEREEKRLNRRMKLGRAAARARMMTSR